MGLISKDFLTATFLHPIINMVTGAGAAQARDGGEPAAAKISDRSNHGDKSANISPPKDRKRGRESDQGMKEGTEHTHAPAQLENKRVAALKGKNTGKRNRGQVQSYREPSSSLDTGLAGAAGVNASSQGSLGSVVQGEKWIGPPVDGERARVIYGPVKGPVRFHTCWLPSNLTVSQKEYVDVVKEEVKKEVKKEEVEEDRKSVPQSEGGTIDVEDEHPSESEKTQVDSGRVDGGGTAEGGRNQGEREVFVEAASRPPSGAEPSHAVAPLAGSPLVDATPNENRVEDETPIVVESYAGYRSVIATHGCHRGAYVYEVQVACDVAENNFFGIRLGWSTKSHELDRILHQPVAAIHGDGYGFNVVNTKHATGSVFYSLCKGKKGCLPVSNRDVNMVKKGDVFAVVIHMGDQGRDFEIKEENIVQFRGNLRDYIMTDGPDWLEGRREQKGSYMELFWNGKSQGRVFVDGLLESTYYPMVSLFTSLDDAPLGEKDPAQRARVEVRFNAETFAYEYPQGIRTLEDKVVI